MYEDDLQNSTALLTILGAVVLLVDEHGDDVLNAAMCWTCTPIHGADIHCNTHSTVQYCAPAYDNRLAAALCLKLHISSAHLNTASACRSKHSLAMMEKSMLSIQAVVLLQEHRASSRTCLAGSMQSAINI